MKGKVDAQVVACTGNPMFNGNFLDEDKVVASGYSNSPWLLAKSGDNWGTPTTLDEGVNKKKAAAVANNAFGGDQVFFDGVKLGAGVKSEPVDTKHQNYINGQKAFLRTPDKLAVLTTSDANGFMHYWDVSKK
jgi:hypothetical protein